MAWSEQEVLTFQQKNKAMLDEVNATLTKQPDSKPKIGIFAQGQVGDLATCMSVLKYAEELWPNKAIIWFANTPNADLLKYSIVSEVRPWPWAGNGLPIGTPDFFPLLCGLNNRLNKELASQYELTKDLEEGYFPTPWMYSAEAQHGVDYPNVSRRCFGVSDDAEWHPVLKFSHQEIRNAIEFKKTWHRHRKTIMLETFAGSGQSAFWDESLTKKVMATCIEKLGPCNFIFGSNKHKGGPDNCGFPNEQLFDNDGCFSAGHFTPRQVALLIDDCDLMVCLSSGISVVTSCWGTLPIPKIQYCGSRKCSTFALATGPFYLVETDFKPKPIADAEFFNKLNEILENL